MRKALLLAGFCLAILMNSALAQVPQSQHVFVVVEEGNGYASVIGSSSMPYLNQLASQYGLATQYYANTTSPIANYFVMTTGQPITTSESFAGTVTQDNLVRHLLQAGKTWKSYAENLPSAGYTGPDKYPYLKSSNPFAFFEDVANSSEKMNLVPFTQFESDLANAALPNFSFIVPNAMDRMRDCPSGMATCTYQQKQTVADNWLKTHIAPLLASKTFQEDGILFIVFNRGAASDTRNGGGQAAMLVIGPSVKSGYKSTAIYSHQNLLKTLMEAAGADSFPAPIASTPSMQDFFKAQATAASSTSASTAAATVSTTSSTTTGGVTISTPANGATVSSPVPVVASATSTYPITAMRIYVDNVSKYAVNASSVNTSISLANGAHTIIVQAWNSKGTVFKSTRSINVGASTTSSTGKVTVTSPSNGASVSSPATFVASATAKSGASITAMQIYVDGALKYQVNAASLNTSLPLAAGSHAITVQAWDNTGAYYKAPLTVNAVASGSTTTTAGKVTVTSPSNGASVSSPTTFVASATATTGASITAMQIYVDGSLQYTVNAASLNTSLAMAAGTHAITVQAWDNTGAYYKAPLSVNVGSTAPAPSTGSTGAAYYVATNGSDSNPGTLSAPWRTIQHAANVLKPGQTVYVRGGTYNERVTPANSGTSTAWIYYKNYPGETAIVDGTGISLPADDSKGIFQISDKSYVEVNGLEVRNSARAGISIWGSSHYINIKNNNIHNNQLSGLIATYNWYNPGVDHVLIDGNDFSHNNLTTRQENISLINVSAFEVRNNKIHDMTVTSTGNEIGVDVKEGTTGGSIHNNELYNVVTGIYLDARQTTSNVEIYDNTLHNNRGASLYLASENNGGALSNVNLYDNLVYNNSGRGFVMESTTVSKQFTLINNTFYNNGGAGNICMYGTSGYSSSVVVRNNINDGASCNNYGSLGLTVDHNLFYGGASVVGTSYQTGDPKFVSSTNFQLQTGSAALGKGTATSAPTTNIDGASRSNPPNIGAY